VARAKRKREHGRSAPQMRIRPAEQILIDALETMPDGSILCTSLGRGQFAAEAANRRPAAAIFCFFLDLYARNLAEKVHPDRPTNLRFECRADFPEEEFDLFVFPSSAGGDAELARDYLQSGHLRLRLGGTMYVATENRSDTWLHGELRRLFPKVTRCQTEGGTLYHATKDAPLRKLKNFESRFTFRDSNHLIQAVSRPGVFSHRRVDGGARALMKSAKVRPGDRVLELGCGSGVVSLALALRGDAMHVHAIDSNARAVECTRLGAELNGIPSVQAQLSTAEDLGDGPPPESSFDLVVTNPPYYSNYRIAEIFARQAARVLKPEGTALFVTKQAGWYQERLPELFSSVTVEPVGTYRVVHCRGKTA
jgi:16S rRNA G1207 methylase RsmC